MATWGELNSDKARTLWADTVDSLGYPLNAKIIRSGDLDPYQRATVGIIADLLGRLAAQAQPTLSRASDVSIPAGMKAWHGGDSAPDDIDEASEVQHADGSIGLANKRSILWGRPKQKFWSGDRVPECAPVRIETKWIIAYTPKTYPTPSRGESGARNRNTLTDQLIGRARFLRDRGEIKSPQLLEEAARALSTPIPTGEVLREASVRAALAMSALIGDGIEDLIPQYEAILDALGISYDQPDDDPDAALRALAMGDGS